MAHFVTVECKVIDNKTTAVIHHDVEQEIEAKGYESPYSYRYVYASKYIRM